VGVTLQTRRSVEKYIFFALNAVVRGFIWLISVHEQNTAVCNTVPSAVLNILTKPILKQHTTSKLLNICVAIQGFGGETRGKETIWETQRRWEDNIKMDPQEVGCGGMDWIAPSQVRDRW
jgi:hypothetical protein